MRPGSSQSTQFLGNLFANRHRTKGGTKHPIAQLAHRHAGFGQAWLAREQGTHAFQSLLGSLCAIPGSSCPVRPALPFPSGCGLMVTACLLLLVAGHRLPKVHNGALRTKLLKQLAPPQLYTYGLPNNQCLVPSLFPKPAPILRGCLWLST